MSAPATILLLVRRLDCNDGVAAYIETLVTGLAARGDRVVMVSGPVRTLYGSGSRRDSIRRALVEWLVIDDFATAWPVGSQVRRILALIRTHRVTVLGPQGLAILPYAWLLSRLSQRKMVAMYHPSALGSTARDIPPRRPLRVRLAYRAVCKLFPPARFLAASREIEDFFVNDCGISPMRVHYQVLGIDSVAYRMPTDEEREKSRAALGVTSDTLVCLLCGRLNLVKGHDIAVDAIRELRRQRPELVIRCLFVGAGDQQKQIESYAHQDDMDRVTFDFLGYYNETSKLRALYWATDILLLPSRFEGFGLVVAEAMCCGAVPIRTPSGGARDQIIDGENGFIVPFNDATAMAERISALSDRSRLARMRSCAINFATAKFTKDAMVDGTSNAYRDVAAGNGTGLRKILERWPADAR